MKDAGVTTEQLDWLVLHQANQRILDAAAQRLSIPLDRVVSNLEEYGNTSAASIPLAFDEAVRGGKIKSGDTVSVTRSCASIHSLQEQRCLWQVHAQDVQKSHGWCDRWLRMLLAQLLCPSNVTDMGLVAIPFACMHAHVPGHHSLA